MAAWGKVRLPHARGGVSRSSCAKTVPRLSSPRPWGCFRNGGFLYRRDSVFPTPVGVFLYSGPFSSGKISLPHARGGVSHWNVASSFCQSSSPRPWGCFPSPPSDHHSAGVFPTPVGVFLCIFIRCRHGVCLPHARGGVSIGERAWPKPMTSSPRPWGCFHGRCYRRVCLRVFPTPVGVFPCRHFRGRRKRCLPHARGGVSASSVISILVSRSSPRPWGCF